MINEILSWNQIVQHEPKIGQQGMQFGIDPDYSLILLSRRINSPYNDEILDDGITIEYEGHDVPNDKKKEFDQQMYRKSGKITENGKFANSVLEYKKGESLPRKTKAYEKIKDGIWVYKGIFDLIDYKYELNGNRKVFKFYFKLNDNTFPNSNKLHEFKTERSRLIPKHIIVDVYKRDNGVCCICGSNENLHYDHYLPYSKGGSSVTLENIRILCRSCNLKKSDKIE